MRGNHLPTHEPSYRIDGKVEPEAEGESEGEPEGTTLPNGFVEPEPEWNEALKIWGVAYDIQVYVSGALFLILAIYSLTAIIRLYKKKNLLSLRYFASLNSILLLMGLSRSVYFLIDGYNARGTFPTAVAYFLYTTAFPCITSAFSILFLALLQATKMEFVSPKIQKLRYLVAIIVFHFLLSFITDIVVGLYYNSKVLLFVCQLASVFWGLLLFIGYIYIFHRLYKAARNRQADVYKLTSSANNLANVSPVRRPKLTLNLAVKVTLATALLGLVFAALQIYSMVGVYSIFSDESNVKAWPWWGYKLGLRITEISMSLAMSLVATQPFRYNAKTRTTTFCPFIRLFSSCGSDSEKPIMEIVRMSRHRSRPASMLIEEKGFVRIRKENEFSTDEDSLHSPQEREGRKPSGFSFDPPPSIHLRDSIDNALHDISLRSPGCSSNSSRPLLEGNGLATLEPNELMIKWKNRLDYTDV